MTIICFLTIIVPNTNDELLGDQDPRSHNYAEIGKPVTYQNT